MKTMGMFLWFAGLIVTTAIAQEKNTYKRALYRD